MKKQIIYLHGNDNREINDKQFFDSK